MEKSPINQLDLVLYYLNAISEAGFLTEGSIEEGLAKTGINISTGTLSKVLIKLQKDQYVDVDFTHVHPRMPDIKSYKISWEGEVFILEGGYSSKAIKQQEKEQRLIDLEQRTKRNESKMLILTIVLAVGTSIAAFYYVLEIISFFTHAK